MILTQASEQKLDSCLALKLSNNILPLPWLGLNDLMVKWPYDLMSKNEKCATGTTS